MGTAPYLHRRRRRTLAAATIVLAAGAACSLAVSFRLHRSISVAGPSDAGIRAPQRDVGRDRSFAARDHGETLVDRWRQRLGSEGGWVFLKHIRKAGGTTIRNYIHRALEYHGHSRTFEQFLSNHDEEEAKLHFPFLDMRQQEMAKEHYELMKKDLSSVVEKQKNHWVYYVEQEFTTMDWECMNVDRRFNNSLSVIVLRHPIERLLSEFFYSGPPATEGHEFDGVKFDFIKGIRLRIDREKLYTNATYTDMLAKFLVKKLEPWYKEGPGPFNLYFRWYLGSHYVDNYQLRALSGCATKGCMGRRRVNREQLEAIRRGRPSITPTDATNTTINSLCTMHSFYPIRDSCLQDQARCPTSCDGPCFYPAAAWGPADAADLRHAKHALEGFDLVLITETLDDADQMAFLADAMGVPRDLRLSSGSSNANVEKRGGRENTHFYRDLVSNLTRPHLESLLKENRLEIELYEHARRLNGLMKVVNTARQYTTKLSICRFLSGCLV